MDSDALVHPPLVSSPEGQDLADFLEASGKSGLTEIVLASARAAARIAARVNRGPLDARGGDNSDGEMQKALETFADRAFVEELQGTRTRAFISEQRNAPEALDGEGSFLVALDPLDSASHVDVNVTIGSIFSVTEAPASKKVETSDFLRPGNRQRAAGMIAYGPHTALVFTLGAGTHVATLDPRTGEFRVTAMHIHIPEGKAEFAINAANARHWPAPVRAYVEDCLMGESGPRGKDFNMRWVSSLVADAYRVLRRGGAYLYPDDARSGHARGGLHLIYEANPLALIVEQAGGMAIDGVNRILDSPPESLRAMTPLIFGSADKIERIREYFVDGHRSAARAPLFGKRGLLRG